MLACFFPAVERHIQSILFSENVEQVSFILGTSSRERTLNSLKNLCFKKIHALVNCMMLVYFPKLCRKLSPPDFNMIVFFYFGTICKNAFTQRISSTLLANASKLSCYKMKIQRDEI